MSVESINLVNSKISEELKISTVGEALHIFEKLKSLFGILLMNLDGYIIKSNLSNEASGRYCNIVKGILDTSKPLIERLTKSKSKNEVNAIRINSCKQELSIFPYKEFVLIIIQNPSDQSIQSQN